MEITDIIKQDSDRFFILDNECYVIFTGDSIEDFKPFIRIGNWINLPVELIPLLENIIITDLIIGNPSHEQFNIDINFLATNRYIGSRQIVKKYLDFQKIFELDLTNATIVDVEKDIPQASREKIISSRGHFIGIFYTDGNFRITHKKNNIFNLNEAESKYFHDTKIHSLIYEKYREANRYSGNGLVLIQSNPMFYKNKFFTSYHFPRKYYEEFIRLMIDPAKIREIILPSSNIINITKLLKWKHKNRSKLKIFSDYKENIDIIQRLFSGVVISRQDFKGLTHDTGDGLSIKNYPDSFNIRLKYKNVKPSSEDVAIAYVKGSSGIEQIIKDKLDCIIAGYQVYEENSLRFKGIKQPLAIMSDGNPGIEKLKGNSHVIIRAGIQYEFLKYANFENLLRDISSTVKNNEIAEKINEKEIESAIDRINNLIKSVEKSDFEALKEVFNILALLKIHFANTKNRKFAAALNKTIYDLESACDRNTLFSKYCALFKINIIFYNGSMFEYIEMFDEKPSGDQVNYLLDEIKDDLNADEIYDADIRKYYEKILEDRIRLDKLLRLFYPQLHKHQKEINALKDAIKKKKEEFDTDTIGIGDIEIEKSRIKSALKRFTKKFTKKSGIKLARILAILIAVLILLLAGHSGYKYYKGYKKEQAKIVEQKKKEAIIKKYNIKVADTDIFEYANKVAVSNGYSPIAYATLKTKNPNWIWPGNIFILLDKEKIIVQEGNTLWGISHRKLIEMYIEFYKTFEKIKEGLSKGKDMQKEIEKAQGLAFTALQRKQLSSLTAVPGQKGNSGR